MSPDMQVSPLVSRLWGRLFAIQDRLTQNAPQHAEAMRGQEFKEIRDRLGLSASWLADQYKIPLEEVSRWESVNKAVPEQFVEALVKLDLTTHAVIDNEIDRLQRTPIGQRTVTVYNDDADYHLAHPEAAPLPASWHRAVYSRVADDVEGILLGTR